MIRGLMTDEEWAIFAPLLTMPLVVAGVHPRTIGTDWTAYSGSAGPERRGAICRRRSAMELGVEAIPSLVRDVRRLGPFACDAG